MWKKISSNLRLELISLQRSKGPTEKFNCVQPAELFYYLGRGGDFWAVIANKTISETLEGIYQFVSTHNCEQTPFLNEINKSDLRVRITVENFFDKRITWRLHTEIFESKVLISFPFQK
jgi:hypothetical protein